MRHVEIDDIGAEALEGLFEGEAEKFWGEILFAFAVAAGFAGIGIEVVAEFPADFDFVARDRFEELAKEGFGPTVAVGVAGIEEGDSLIKGELHEAKGLIVGVMPPPIDAEGPAAETDGGDFEGGVAEFAAEHDPIIRRAGEFSRVWGSGFKGKQATSNKFKNRDGLLARDWRKPIQKIVEGVSTL